MRASIGIGRGNEMRCALPSAAPSSRVRSPPLGRRLGGRGVVGKASSEAVASECERGVVILPGLGRGSGAYVGLQKALTAEGYEVEICVINVVDWLRNAAGLRDGNYWRGTLNPRPTVDWYLNRIEEAVEKVKRGTDGAPITLVGHSAGGWLGRLYMKEFGTTGIEGFVSLGTPHSPPPKDRPDVFDQTRGILSFCEQEFPGNYHSDVHYVTVAGKYMKGCNWNDGGSIQEKVTGVIYKQVCGDADVWGDGVVPNVSSHLDGAINLELTDVFHGPLLETEVPTETDDDAVKSRVWYGSIGVAEKWMALLDPVRNGYSLK